jgi:hypothetical protein
LANKSLSMQHALKTLKVRRKSSTWMISILLWNELEIG